MRIAVIGSGISGLSAAYLLSRRHEVTLFEASERLGGHGNTVQVETGTGPLAIDTGFIVCNPVNYPNFYKLMAELGVALVPSDMSLGVSVGQGRVEWAGDDNLLKIFAQPSLMASPTHLRMLASVLRFNRHVKTLLAEDRLPEITLGDFLEQHHYPMALRVRYVAAMAGPIWSTSTRGVMAFPFPAFARFFESHGLLNVADRPQWMTVDGGSRSYVERLRAKSRATIHTGTPVRGLSRTAGGARLRTDTGDSEFDAVVCAAHADQALALLEDAGDAERSVLGAVPFAGNQAVLHRDPGLMPRRRRVWSSWNALLAEDRLSDSPVGVTYWMNRLQPLRTDQQWFVSLNPPRPPAREGVVYETTYTHPQYTPATIAAQRRLPEIQGAKRVWWAGAWTAYGFHEDGLRSGLRAVAGIDRDCLPEWAEGL
jgi:predicted NAD/FAD-binding protein